MMEGEFSSTGFSAVTGFCMSFLDDRFLTSCGAEFVEPGSLVLADRVAFRRFDFVPYDFCDELSDACDAEKLVELLLAQSELVFDESLPRLRRTWHKTLHIAR